LLNFSTFAADGHARGGCEGTPGSTHVSQGISAMKARLLCALALLVVCAASGCHNVNLCDGTGVHGHGHGGGRIANHRAAHGLGRHGGGGSGLADGHNADYGHHFSRTYDGPQGPPTAQVGYPYYTTRGPRDFFTNNPPSIGN
jgi:hypothetical protein